MKLEEILPMLRAGKHIRNKNFDTNEEYWMAGYIGIGDEMAIKTLTIHRVNKQGKAFRSSHEWGMPRWLIMDDGWELIK